MHAFSLSTSLNLNIRKHSYKIKVVKLHKTHLSLFLVSNERSIPSMRLSKHWAIVCCLSWG